MKGESVQVVQQLIAKLEALPLAMGGGDAEREALVTRLTEAGNRLQEPLLSDLWLTMRLLGSTGQRIVCDAFAVIAAREAAAIEFASYPVPADHNAADNLLRKLTAAELPLEPARRRSSIVRKLQAYLDNDSHKLAVQDKVDAARLLEEEGYGLVEALLRSLLIGPLELAASKLWTEVTAHFGAQVSLAQYLEGVRLTLPRRQFCTTSARIKNLLPHITAAADAAYCLSKNIDLGDIDEVTDRIASKLELIGEGRVADLDPAECDGHYSALRHRIAGVDRQVNKHLMHLPGIRQYSLRRGIQIADQFDIAAEKRSEHPVVLCHEFVQLHGLGDERYVAAEREQLPGQRRPLLACPDHLFDRPPLRAASVRAEQQLAGSADDHQEVVEIVCDRPSQPSHAVELVCLPKTSFKDFLVGNIRSQAGHPDSASVGAPQDSPVPLNQPANPIPLDQWRLKMIVRPT